MSNQPTKPASGVLIRVSDLDICRNFYRDMLRLGAPVVNSGFWVEFAAPDGTRIILEKSAAAYLEHSASATTLVLSLPQAAAIRKELAESNYEITENLKIHPGEAFYRGVDPEGNVYYICSNES